MTAPQPACNCYPEDGDYGSGYHFESCPLAPAQRAAMDRAERHGRAYRPGEERPRSNSPR